MNLLLIWADTKIRNIRQLEALQSETYVLAVIMAILFLAICIAIAESIAFEGGKNPSDPRRRRTWFWVLFVTAPVIFFLYNYLYVKNTIVNAALQAKFISTNIISTIIVVVLYFVAGFLLSKAWKNSKFGTIFPSRK